MYLKTYTFIDYCNFLDKKEGNRKGNIRVQFIFESDENKKEYRCSELFV